MQSERVLYSKGNNAIVVNVHGKIRVDVGAWCDYPLKGNYDGMILWDAPDKIPNVLRRKVADFLKGWTLLKGKHAVKVYRAKDCTKDAVSLQ
jgi:hypothetical protein